MFLKRITVTGFKSFAGKTVLDLEPGVTAVVGPNGSGKSNLADAVRWALGEQHKGRLRLSDREEVVFAGSDKRARASYAEVILLFDNQDGAFPVELTEVEISRRLYRSGETDYRLGGRSVRLADIQQLLAEAGLGTNTYAVIGQGTIDSFILSSPAERKLLFDEAAGIRGAELKREAAMRKLAATAANLTRLRDINAELAPRLASLERAMAAAAEQRALEQRLAEHRQAWVAMAAAELAQQAAASSATAASERIALHSLRHEVRGLERAQHRRLAEAASREALIAASRAHLRKLETERDGRVAEAAQLQTKLSEARQVAGQAQSLLMREKRLNTELATARGRQTELSEELAANQAAASRAAKSLERAGQDVSKAQAELVELRQSVSDGTQQQYVTHALALLKTIAQSLDRPEVSGDELRLLVHKAGRLLSHATKTGEAELLRRLKAAQQHLEAAMTRRDTATEHQTNITITRRSLEIDADHQDTATERTAVELATVEAELGGLAYRPEQLKRLEQAAGAKQYEAAELVEAARRVRIESDYAAQASAPAAELAAAATALERLQNRRQVAEASLATTREAAATLVELRRTYRRRAQAWGLTWPVGDETKAATVEAQSATTASLAGLDRDIDRLEAELTARQELQQDTVTEHAEVSGRHSELAAQIMDLEQAQVNLGGVVTELDALIRVRFKDNFAALAGHFSTYFTRLFGGGSASLELTEGEDGEYGIIIKANPKGKRVSNLSALSGGERAMAGVALLAAILNVNPSPFVVLDEVDAALDEANSGRLGSILEELAEKSQFIVITHNRQTMRAAKVLFGVTMNEHHVSHLLSLRLEEATALAAR